MSAFITWVDSGTRVALPKTTISQELCIPVDTRENADDVNIEDIEKMVSKATNKMNEVKTKQEGLSRTLSSLR